MPVFTPADHQFFKDNGYVIVPNAVPQENLDAVIALIWDFLGMNPDDPADWYRLPLTPGGMLEVYQHQALWDNRQNPRVHQAFSELLGTEKLWVSFDRVNMKPPQNPAHPEYDHKGFIHWDTDTSQMPQPFGVQGVLCLTDTTPGMGGFQCVPELYRVLEAWMKTQPADRNPRAPDLSGFHITPIAARAGDLIIWDRLLPHGNGQNVSQNPRLAQYIAMSPASADLEARDKRVEMWRERRAPSANWVIGDPRGWEQEHEKTAELTPLGRKLLGVDRWEQER